MKEFHCAITYLSNTSSKFLYYFSGLKHSPTLSNHFNKYFFNNKNQQNFLIRQTNKLSGFSTLQNYGVIQIDYSATYRYCVLLLVLSVKQISNIKQNHSMKQVFNCTLQIGFKFHRNPTNFHNAILKFSAKDIEYYMLE